MKSLTYKELEVHGILCLIRHDLYIARVDYGHEVLSLLTCNCSISYQVWRVFHGSDMIVSTLLTVGECAQYYVKIYLEPRHSETWKLQYFPRMACYQDGFCFVLPIKVFSWSEKP